MNGEEWLTDEEIRTIKEKVIAMRVVHDNDAKQVPFDRNEKVMAGCFIATMFVMATSAIGLLVTASRWLLTH